MHDLRANKRPSLDVLMTGGIAFMFAVLIFYFLLIALIETQGFLFRIDWENFEFFGVTSREAYFSFLMVLVGLFILFTALHIILLHWWKRRNYSELH